MFHLPIFCFKSNVYNLRIYDFTYFTNMLCVLCRPVAKEMACTDQGQVSEENKQIRGGKKKMRKERKLITKYYWTGN